MGFQKNAKSVQSTLTLLKCPLIVHYGTIWEAIEKLNAKMYIFVNSYHHILY
jgi:hypothetical protein